MIAVTRILCPINSSDFTRRALRYALALGPWYGAGVVALHVRPRAVAPSMWGEEVPSPALHALLEGPAADETVRRLVEEVANNLPLTVAFRDGPVATEIVKAAAELGCDLIIIGSDGASGFERLKIRAGRPGCQVTG